MSELGLGIGIENFPAGVAGGGGGVVAPTALSDLVVWLTPDAYTYEQIANEPSTATAVTNLAGATWSLSFANTASDTPRIHTVPHVGGDDPPGTIPNPNGERFWGTESGFDSGLVDRDEQSLIMTPQIDKADMEAFSYIVAVFMNRNDAVARKMFGSDAGGRYHAFNEDGGVWFSFDGGAPTIHNNSSHANADQWHILQFSWITGTIAQWSVDGVALATNETEAAVESSCTMSTVFYHTQLTTQYADYAFYKTNHSLETLNPVAQSMANRLGIAYTYTPLP